MDEMKVYSGVTQYIKIEMGEETFGIDIGYVDNILRMQRITRVPNVPAYIKGVINLRGEIVPIMNLRLKMGLEEDVTTKNTRIIILRLEQYGMIGIIVDEVKEVLTLEEDCIEKVRLSKKQMTVSKAVITLALLGTLLGVGAFINQHIKDELIRWFKPIVG